MNRNYERPTVPKEWSDCRETCTPVAVAIHAIADSNRSPEAIWEAPTPAEFDHVKMAVTEYIAHNDFPEWSDDTTFPWGDELLTLDTPR